MMRTAVCSIGSLELPDYVHAHVFCKGIFLADSVLFCWISGVGRFVFISAHDFGFPRFVLQGYYEGKVGEREGGREGGGEGGREGRWDSERENEGG